MQRTESYRRAQYKRAQKKAYFLVHDVWRYHDQGKYSMSIDELWTFSKKCLTHNRKNCSGDCCKNPRRTKYGKGKNGLTYQEKREFQDKIAPIAQWKRH